MNQTLLRTAVCGALLLACSAASAACYSVYSRGGKLLYRNAETPVDMGRHLRHSVPKKYGRGATMVFEAPLGSSCTEISNLRRKSRYRKVEDVDAVLANLAEQNLGARGRMRGRSDQWLADVDFK